MIPIATALRAVLSDAAAVTALVSGRIYDDALPVASDPTLPALVLQSWFIKDIKASSGASGFEDHRLQVDAYAASRRAADALMEVVANTFEPRAPAGAAHVAEGLRLTIRQDSGGGRPTYERETKFYRRSLDFKVQAARAA